MTKPMSKQKLAATVLDSEELAVAATLHNIHTDTTTSSDSNQDTDNITDTTTSSSSSGDNSSIVSSSTSSDHIGTGPQLDMKAYSMFESTLEQLQVHPTDIVRTEDTFIGKGGFAKVYKVQLKGQQQLCAAKVSTATGIAIYMHMVLVISRSTYALTLRPMCTTVLFALVSCLLYCYERLLSCVVTCYIDMH
jgi:hypothetical protein